MFKAANVIFLIHGKGVVSERPITVVQGDITAGIGNITSSTSKKNIQMYNTTGQRIQKNYKGIIIQNGTKRINK